MPQAAGLLLGSSLEWSAMINDTTEGKKEVKSQVTILIQAVPLDGSILKILPVRGTRSQKTEKIIVE